MHNAETMKLLLKVRRLSDCQKGRMYIGIEKASWRIMKHFAKYVQIADDIFIEICYNYISVIGNI